MAQLLGNRIYLEMPKKEESKIVVDENTKEALQKEFLKKMNRLLPSLPAKAGIMKFLFIITRFE